MSDERDEERRLLAALELQLEELADLERDEGSTQETQLAGWQKQRQDLEVVVGELEQDFAKQNEALLASQLEQSRLQDRSTSPGGPESEAVEALKAQASRLEDAVDVRAE